MRAGWLAFGAIVFAASAGRAESPATDAPACGACHPAIWRDYRQSAMARSFFRPGPENTIEDYTHNHTYYHQASDTHFEMIQRDGQYLQRQYQIGFDGTRTSVAETAIDFVLGSGNHSRTYLHRTAQNTLIELPLGWYAEKGGYWAMNPGYDRPDHQSLTRAIGYDCMFCHNAYPEIPAKTGPRSQPVFLSVAEGIDCQRCHGDGRHHATLAATAGTRVEEIRAAIVNPARLPFDRQIEVCMQCHLETTSFSTTNAIVRYEREPFSYRPGEPLAGFRLHFDRKPEKTEDRFEIVGAAYRLRQSQCFLKSKGAMTCTTCHDPHQPASAHPEHYPAVCRQCHAAALDAMIAARRHPAASDCIACHMPLRRTEDAVHVAMTDHYIQRRPPADLLAPIPERAGPEYRGEAVPYYPAALHASDDLYLGVAQANEPATRAEGIARLTSDIAKYRPAQSEFYLQLGDALRASRRFDEALAPYRRAVDRDPQSPDSLERLALGLDRARQYPAADAVFKDALQLAPRDAAMWTHRGMSYLEQNRMQEAAQAFQESLALDPAIPEAHNGLAGARMAAGDTSGAETEFRQAIRLNPNYAEARHNLANVLAAAGSFNAARYQFEQALRIHPDRADTRYDFAAMLARAARPEDAARELTTLLEHDPQHARARDLLGNVLLAEGRTAEAIAQFREAVRIAPQFARAHLDLGAALAASGEISAARPYLEKAAKIGDAQVREQARKLLERTR